MKMGMAEIAEAVPVHPVTGSAYTEKAKNGSVFDFYVNKLLYRIFSDNSNFIPCILRLIPKPFIIRAASKGWQKRKGSRKQVWNTS